MPKEGGQAVFMGCYVFSICTVDFQEEETYEFIGPHGMVMASAVRTRFNPRTEIRVCANTAKSDNPVEVMCQAGFFSSVHLGIQKTRLSGGNHRFSALKSCTLSASKAVRPVSPAG